jgi:hypothetical protein
MINRSMCNDIDADADADADAGDEAGIGNGDAGVGERGVSGAACANPCNAAGMPGVAETERVGIGQSVFIGIPPR